MAYDNSGMQMARRFFALLFFANCVRLSYSQIEKEPDWTNPNEKVPGGVNDDKLPDGKSRTNAIAADEHKKALEETDQLIKLAQQLRSELGEAGKFVVPISAVRKTEDIEKLVKRIRARLRS